MLCCSNCFDDVHLRQLFSLYSIASGTCAFCGASDQSLAKPSDFKELFENLVDAYIPDRNGKYLVDCFHDDWALFPGNKINIGDAWRLLSEVLDDGNIVRQKFSLPKAADDDMPEKWLLFKNELKHQNRFFTDNEIDFSVLEMLLPYIYLVQDEFPESWFRSRLAKDGQSFDRSQMLAPPKELVGNGRANPAGIPYLYLSSDEVTAISEIRPHTGETVNVIEVRIPSELKLIDLRNPRRRASPLELFWVVGDIGKLYQGVMFLEFLGIELSRPIQKHAADYDYVPSQYLCEFIKKAGYDGVVYKSSLGDGFNAALFNHQVVDSGEVKNAKVDKVTVTISNEN